MKFASASLSFYLRGEGYLVCNENRNTYKGGPKDTPMFNTIGGKVEDGEDILDTAIREFSEEALLDIEAQGVLRRLVEDNIFFYDFCCSVPKQLYHRFFVVDLKYESNYDSVEGFIVDFMAKRSKDDGVNSLVWVTDASEEDGVKPTNLLVEFFKLVENDYALFKADMDTLKKRFDSRFEHLTEHYINTRPLIEEVRVDE